METLFTVVHVIVALVLIGLVLIQDSKGGALGIGGGGSNTVLGAGGAQTLAAKATRWVAMIFAITSIGLSVMTAQKTKSVVETMGTVAVPATAPSTTPTPAETTPAATPAPTTEAAPATK
jgi:preprotein translocase subunit SecG